MVEDEIIKLHKNYCEKTLFDSNPKWLEPIECVVLGGEGGKTNGFRQYPLNGFIDKLLTDDEFYEKWGNGCCEEISRNERIKMYYDTYAPGMRMIDDHWMDAKLKTREIPKRKLKEDEKI
jgi:hypothetical protein